jgi:hypothetical protein
MLSRWILVTIALLSVACDESSPTSPAPIENFGAAWGGTTRRQGCSIGGVPLSEDSDLTPSAMGLGLTLAQSRGNVRRRLTLGGTYAFDVTGRVSGNSLTLSGQNRAFLARNAE